MTAVAASRLRLDPRTFEILRHRLWYINDEGALTISRVSGSPVATEVFDMNTGLMTAEGELVYIDNFICAQATTLAAHVEYLRREMAENPGFEPGDVFLCNDPYVSVCHQTCVQVAAPIFHGDELVAWAGASLHAIDTGGPTAGQVQLDAADIHGEQPLFGPVKVVERGRFRKDIESMYLKNSRVPDLLALDLRAKVAAVDVIRRRMAETFEEFGVDTVLAGMADVIDYTERRMRARLRELPDGTWRHRGYIELGEDIYTCQVTMHKRGDELVFDFSDTDAQAPAVINCTIHGLRGGVLAAMLVYLCWDIPWSPAALSRIVEVRSRPGTVVHAQWPAGVSKSTTTGIWEVRNLASITIGKMLAASDRHRDRAMAGWQGTKTLEELFGHDGEGRTFAGPLLDGMAGRRRGDARARRHRHRRAHELAARDDRQRRELRVPLPDPVPVPPAGDRLGRSGQVPRRRRRDDDVHRPGRGADSHQDPAHLRDRGAGVARDCAAACRRPPTSSRSCARATCASGSRAASCRPSCTT